MNTRYLSHKEIDFEKWENCVSNSLNGCVYGRTWYLDIVSMNWDGIVKGDYEAVMPVFRDEEKMVMPFGMTWTGIYSRNGLTEDLCQEFIDIIDRKFKYINLTFDKYFPGAHRSLGRFSEGTVYQMDTFKGISTLETQSPAAGVNYNLYSCRDHISETIQAITYDDLMGVNKSLSFKSALPLKFLAFRSVYRKYGYYSELIYRGVTIKGSALVIFSDNYIFMPFFGVKGNTQETQYGQMLLLTHIVNKYFRHRPGILVIDDKETGIEPKTLEQLGFKKYTTTTYKVDMISKFTNLFKTNRQTQTSK